jgi:hypothetical protein
MKPVFCAYELISFEKGTKNESEITIRVPIYPSKTLRVQGSTHGSKSVPKETKTG